MIIDTLSVNSDQEIPGTYTGLCRLLPLQVDNY